MPKRHLSRDENDDDEIESEEIKKARLDLICQLREFDSAVEGKYFLLL